MRIGIDLGTSSVLAWAPGKGIILNEPAVLAQDVQTGATLAHGSAAQQMIGRVSSDVRTVSPVIAGRLADPEVATELLRRGLGKRWGSELHIAVGDTANSYACQALIESLRKAGVRKATLVPRALAAARGAGLPVHETRGHAIVNLGAGGTEVAILSMNQVLTTRNIASGGTALDEAVIRHMQSEHGLDLSLEQAREVKEQLGYALAEMCQGNRTVWGRDQATGLPRQAELTAQSLCEALAEPLARIVRGVQQALEQVPPGLAADLVDRGLILTGGGAHLRGLDTYLQSRLQLPVQVAENPLACVAAGALPPAPPARPSRFSRLSSKLTNPTKRVPTTV